MSKITYESVLIIGMGLIGSSIARILKEKKLSNKIFALDTDNKVINTSRNLNLVDKIELTRVYKDYQGDTFFPDIPLDKFELDSELVNYLDDDSNTKYSFLTYIKK